MQHYLQLNPVQTPLGDTIDSSSEEWRAWCEARHVIKIAHISDRQSYIEAVRTKRGVKSAKDLMDKMQVLWNMKQN